MAVNSQWLIPQPSEGDLFLYPCPVVSIREDPSMEKMALIGREVVVVSDQLKTRLPRIPPVKKKGEIPCDLLKNLDLKSHRASGETAILTPL